MEAMEVKEKVLSDTCSPTDINSSDHETLLRLLVEKDAEILKLKEELISCQEQLAISLSNNEKTQAKITGIDVAPHQVNVVSVSVQVPEDSHDTALGEKPMPKWNDGGDANSASIADILKETAEGEIGNQGIDSSEQHDGANQVTSEYIFDSNSGFYYHPATGYYWDPNSGLFYDYTSGLYYWYNEKTQSYEVHSSVDGQNDVNSSTSKIPLTTRSSSKAKDRTGRKSRKDSPADSLRRRIKRKRLKKEREVPVTKDTIRKENILDSVCDQSATVNEDEMSHDQLDVEMKQTGYESDSSGSLASGESELVSDLESGELTSSTEETNEQITEDSLDLRLPEPEEPAFSEAMAEDYPPCIRFIVQASESLASGDLYIVTCSGGSIGREASTGHALLIPDTSVSKMHAEIIYDYEDFCYKIRDLGSQNGTFLSKHRLSQSKKQSSYQILSHGDVLQVGNDTKLLSHIHKGHETCEDCEPGQVQAKLRTQNPTKNNFQVLSKEERRIQQKQELKRIKKKFGLQNSYYENPGAAIKQSGYEDKAMLRRKLVGSENDKGRDENPASVHRPITASNKGHKLLAKMGWTEGEGLGKSNTGIAEPINVELRLNQGAGLGSSEAASLSIDNLQQANKMKRWNQARQRFNKVTAESKATPDSTHEAETPLESANTLNPSDIVHSQTTDISSFPPVSRLMSSSPSSPSTVNKDSVIQRSRILWVKGETQQPP